MSEGDAAARASRGAQTSSSGFAADTGRSSRMIYLGIVLGRLLGLARDRVLYVVNGLDSTNDVLLLGLKFANSLQTLLGEQALSAGFIPAYSERLGAAGPTPERARRLAGAVFTRLMLVAGSLGIAGALLAPQIGGLAARSGDESVQLLTLVTRFLFPMAALIVLAAWCLAVLNSHRRFFLSYFAPAFWNLCILAALAALFVLYREPTARQLVMFFGVGALAGGLVQFLAQLPLAMRLNGGLPMTLRSSVEGLAEVQKRFAPVLLGRGSLQLVGVAEAALAVALLGEGAFSGLAAGQRLFFLTILVTGMVQAIVYLPEFSRLESGSEFDGRLREALHGVWFLVVPSVVGVILFGFVLVAPIYRGGNFGVVDNLVVYLFFAVYSVGLLPTASNRVLQSVFYSRGLTRLPAVSGVVRASASLLLALGTMSWFAKIPVSSLGALPLVSSLSLEETPMTLAALAFAVSSSVCSAAEFLWLWTAARKQRLATEPMGSSNRLPRFALLAVVSALPAAIGWWGTSLLMTPGSLVLGVDPVLIVQAGTVVGLYAGCYLLLSRGLGFAEFERLLGRRPRASKPGTGGGRSPE